MPTALLLTPPISAHTKKPFSSNTLRNAIGALVEALKQKYQGEWEEALFPVEEVSRWKKIVTDGHNWNLMEGEKENDVFKNTFPLPRQHLVRTRLFPLADFEDSDMHQLSSQTDMYMICDTLIARERFKALAKILFTFKCIGRGGEVKFLSYQ